MLNKNRRTDIERWFKNNGIPENKWDHLIKMLNSHKLTTTDGVEMKDLLGKYDKIKKLTEKLQREIDLLSDQSLKELDTLLEDNLLHEQSRLKKNDPVNRLTPRHLGDIDISLYLSSLILTCENIPKVKKKVRDEKVYSTLLWFCHSLDRQFNFGIDKNKAALFIAAFTGKDEDSVKRQLDRLLKNHKWNFFTETI